MSITTIKRFQSDPEWWYTLEDCNTEVHENPQTGLCLKYYDENHKEGKQELVMSKENALLFRDALNQLYPQNNV